MNIIKLKETLRKQCDVNHQTVIATQILRKFNADNDIIEAMKPIRKVGV